MPAPPVGTGEPGPEWSTGLTEPAWCAYQDAALDASMSRLAGETTEPTTAPAPPGRPSTQESSPFPRGLFNDMIDVLSGVRYTMRAARRERSLRSTSDNLTRVR